MTNKERDQLIAAHKAVTAMLLATIDGQNDRCGSFHIAPFKTHWDRTTVEEVMKEVKIYLRSWVYSPMTEALGQEDLLQQIVQLQLQQQETAKRLDELTCF